MDELGKKIHAPSLSSQPVLAPGIGTSGSTPSAGLRLTEPPGSDRRSAGGGGAADLSPGIPGPPPGYNQGYNHPAHSHSISHSIVHAAYANGAAVRSAMGIIDKALPPQNPSPEVRDIENRLQYLTEQLWAIRRALQDCPAVKPVSQEPLAEHVEIARLTQCLAQANARVAECERKFSLKCDELDALRTSGTDPEQHRAIKEAAACFEWIENHAVTHGGGTGFTVLVPADHENLRCGVLQAISDGEPRPANGLTGMMMARRRIADTDRLAWVMADANNVEAIHARYAAGYSRAQVLAYIDDAVAREKSR